ncbi:hypothetical protein SGLAM104S_08492 [Streptomyces glaucescens]
MRLDDVYREGMTEVTAADFASAKEMGCTIKLLAICERAADGESVTARVHPAMIPLTHPLASVRGAYNAVFVESDASGQLMFYGPGAGGAPTASAVLGDLVAVCRNRLSGTTGPGESAYAALRVSPMGEVVTRYHISLDVADKPGVLAQVATVFAEHGVSIDTVRQQGKDGEASLVVVTHRASDAALNGTVEALRKLDTVRGVASIMRVEASNDPPVARNHRGVPGPAAVCAGIVAARAVTIAGEARSRRHCWSWPPRSRATPTMSRPACSAASPCPGWRTAPPGPSGWTPRIPSFRWFSCPGSRS